MTIHILKSNIRTSEDAAKVGQHFDAEKDIIRWSVDIEDCDGVLRILVNQLTLHQIVEITQNAGFECSELTE